MDSFQITVLIVAAVFLILIFTSVGLLIKYSSVNNVYPPMTNTCPDYWSVDTDKNCIIPGSSSQNPNIGNIYASSGYINLTNDSTDTSKIFTPGYDSQSGIINFSDSGWSSQGKSAICYQNTWASKNKVVWDGVSNYNSC